MALFGIDFYGLGQYGAEIAVEFDVSPFFVQAKDYGSLYVQWDVPTGAANRLVLVRSQTGFPINVRDGAVMIDTTSISNVRSYDDTDVVPGQFYYYAIFLFSTAANDFRLAGLAIGLPTQNYGYSQRLLDLLPNIFKVKDYFALQPTPDELNPSLARFLDIFGFQLDTIKTEYDTLLNTYELNKVSGNLLPLMSSQFGLDFQQSLGQRQARVYLRSAVRMQKLKGTYSGTELFCTSFTSYGVELNDGINLMLDYNQSSFEEDTATWYSVDNKATLTRAGVDVGAVFENETGTNQTKGAGLVTVTSGGTVKFSLTTEGQDVDRVYLPLKFGVPVKGSTQYSFSGYSRNLDAGGGVTFSVGIRWFNAAGQVIQNDVQSTAVAINQASFVRAIRTETSPASAVYAVPTFVFNNTVATNRYFVDAFQHQVGAVTEYQDARDLRITLIAPRINQIRNPGFETNTDGYVLTGATTITRSASNPKFGLWSAYIRNNSAAPALRSHQRGEALATLLRPNTNYWFVCWLRNDVDGAHTVTTTLTLQAEAGTPIPAPAGTSIATLLTDDVAGENTWQKVAFPFATGPTARFASFTWASNTANRGFYLDGILLERSVVEGEFFDGASPGQDFRWEDEELNVGRTHFYPELRGKFNSLNSLLSKYLPAGRTYNILLAQPGD